MVFPRIHSTWMSYFFFVKFSKVNAIEHLPCKFIMKGVFFS